MHAMHARHANRATCVQAALAAFRAALQHKAAPQWLVRARTDVLALSGATAAIMHCYSGVYGRHRDIFRSKYLNVLDFIFGGEGLERGSIVHAHSNRALLLTATVAAHRATKCAATPCVPVLPWHAPPALWWPWQGACSLQSQRDRRRMRPHLPLRASLSHVFACRATVRSLSAPNLVHALPVVS
jgi:hypothetical protein